MLVSHISIIFVALLFDMNFGFGTSNPFFILSSLIPLFGLFLSVIIKDTLAGRTNLKRGPQVNAQMVWVSRIIFSAYVLLCFTTFFMYYRQAIATPEELAAWIASIEIALGVGVGMIIDDLFGGSSSADSGSHQQAMPE